MSSEKTYHLILKILFPAVFVLIISLFLSYKYYQKKINRISDDINSYLEEAYKAERKFIENIPIYQDYATPAREQTLRKYLLKEHIKAAEKYGIKPVLDDSSIKQAYEKGILVSIDGPNRRFYFFHNVRKKYRFLTKGASAGLSNFTERFQKNLNRRAPLPEVKIAVSSAIRPVNYQKELAGRNRNASYISTHSYGTSFDIFYDDYFISFPPETTSNDASSHMLKKLGIRFGYIMGDALRRQLRSILMETLTELQNEGKLYAILEKRQRCYHVTILR